jgi:uncharacterized protein YfdQ (DUF2303 family)
MVDETAASDASDTEDKAADPTPEELARFASHMIFARNSAVHEGGVHGSVIAQSVKFVEDYMTPMSVDMTEPASGLVVTGFVGKDGFEVVSPSVFDAYRERPLFRRGTAQAFDLASYIAHFNRFADGDSVTFANNDRSAPSLTGVLDYHPAGAESNPRFGKHRVTFKFPLSDEWKAWNAMNGKPMSQGDFAKFLEDRIVDVNPEPNLSAEQAAFVDILPGEPGKKIADPSKLMSIAAGLRVTEHSTVAQMTNLDSGEAVIEYSSEHRDESGAKLTLPSLFVLAIPIFVNGFAVQVIARFRYRKQGGTLVFWYDLWRVDRVFDGAFDEALGEVRERTNKPVLLGAPEIVA